MLLDGEGGGRLWCGPSVLYRLKVSKSSPGTLYVLNFNLQKQIIKEIFQFVRLYNLFV
jgi:hypothetical protein